MAHAHYVGGKEALNPAFIKKQNRTEEDIEIILELHNELHKAFDHMEMIDPDNVDEKEQLKNLAIVVKEIEFRLQEAWGFKRSVDWHSWWFQVPHCRCPVLDNWDYVGTKLAVTTGGCPVHCPDP